MATESAQIVIINPTDGAELARYPYANAAAVSHALEAGDAAATHWQNVQVRDRVAVLTAWASEMRQARQSLARQAALEMGKPLGQGLKEVEKCAMTLDFYAEHAAAFLADEHHSLDNGAKGFVRPRPLGLLFGIMPWNFPYWQVIRFAAPALAAGNVILIKHADNTFGCALALQATLDKALASLSVKAPVYQTLALQHQAAHDLIGDRRVVAVSLTGSERAGSAVAARAGACLKKTVLELGGSDPYVIFDDADLDAALPICIEARLVNGGQSCVAAKRFIVTEKHYARFVDGFTALARQKKLGDPLDGGTDIGPIAPEDLRAGLAKQVAATAALGARVTLGGALPGGSGWFYPVTVLDGVKPGMPAFDQEVFGPVAAIVRAKSDDEALALAARTNYGLGAAIFSRNTERAINLARAIRN